MAPPFFPNLAFGWAFVAFLFVFLAVASYMDLSFAIIPKWVSITALPVGIVFNLVRCGWLGSIPGQTTWLWTNAGVALGLLDGLLFSLAGFLFGFAFYLILWILGIAGGGDVKLCASIGAWVGPMLTLWIIIMSIVIVFALVLVNGAYSLAKGNLRGLRKPSKISVNKRARRLLTFSTPLCAATLLVLFVNWRKELGIAPEKPMAMARRTV
jgi:prepilin signal peptidase PulO-like enzyme (type II secretory pathway)